MKPRENITHYYFTRTFIALSLIEVIFFFTTPPRPSIIETVLYAIFELFRLV